MSAFFLIAEYTDVVENSPVAPPVAEQVITISGTTSQQSAAFQVSTNFIEVVATDGANVHLAFGANPTASSSNMFLPTGRVKRFRVPNGSKVAVIQSFD
jgi:hypothetical protein